jgi:hypothetical protein
MADDRASRWPYLVVGIVGGVALLILGAAAPGGETWRWLEMPRHITAIAIVLGLVTAAAGKSVQHAPLVLVGTIAIAGAWEAVDVGGSAVPSLLQTVAPYLVGTVYAALAALAILPASHARRRAGGWLVVVGLVAIGMVLANPSWLTLQNLHERGTFRSSASWPDTKKVALVIACVTTAFGVTFALVRARTVGLPRATMRRSE